MVVVKAVVCVCVYAQRLVENWTLTLTRSHNRLTNLLCTCCLLVSFLTLNLRRGSTDTTDWICDAVGRPFFYTHYADRLLRRRESEEVTQQLIDEELLAQHQQCQQQQHQPEELLAQQQQRQPGQQLRRLDSQGSFKTGTMYFSNVQPDSPIVSELKRRLEAKLGRCVGCPIILLQIHLYGRRKKKTVHAP